MATNLSGNYPTKRKNDSIEIVPTPKKEKLAEESPADYSPLFFTIISAITPEEEDTLSTKEIVQLLSMNHEVIVTMQLASFGKVEEQFKVLIESSVEYKKLSQDISKVLGKLYEASLLNSSTPMELKSTAENLPRLKEKFERNIKKDLEDTAKQSSKLLSSLEKVSSLEEICKSLPKIDEMLRALDNYRTLKHYSNPHENQRMLDLANLIKRQQADVQYPVIISDYPKIVDQIYRMSPQLESVSNLFVQLNARKLELEKMRQSMQPKQEESSSPIQTRFLNAFGASFYDAFAEHFWTLLWNSKQDPELKEFLMKIKSWEDAKPEKIDVGLINTIWNAYLPESDFSDWMLLVLASLSPLELDALEERLQALSKKYTEERQNQKIEIKVSESMQKSILNQMKEVCRLATKPSFTKLNKLKSLLKKA